MTDVNTLLGMFSEHRGLEVTGKWELYTYLSGVSQAGCAPAMLLGKLRVFSSQEAFD